MSTSLIGRPAPHNQAQHCSLPGGPVIKAVIVCRDFTTTEHLRSLLTSDGHFEVLADCVSVMELGSVLQRHRPEVVLVETVLVAAGLVRMLPRVCSLPLFLPVSDGELARDESSRDSWMVRLHPGFDVAALAQRVHTVLPETKWSRRCQQFVRALAGVPPHNGGRLVFKIGRHLVALEPAAVESAEREEGWTTIHTRARVYRTDWPLRDVADKLGAQSFCRISSRAIVNVGVIQEVRLSLNSGGSVVLDSGKVLVVERAGARRLLSMLNAMRDAQGRHGPGKP